jgi:hypothetical protein
MLEVTLCKPQVQRSIFSAASSHLLRPPLAGTEGSGLRWSHSAPELQHIAANRQHEMPHVSDHIHQQTQFDTKPVGAPRWSDELTYQEGPDHGDAASVLVGCEDAGDATKGVCGVCHNAELSCVLRLHINMPHCRWALR